MCIFFLVALAATVAGIPQDCRECYKSMSPKGPWLPWCDCSSETQELVASGTPESADILDSSPYHETDIYYEPDEEYLTLTKVLFQQPFYINNPTFNFKLKTPKREVVNKQSLKVTVNSPMEIDEIITSQERPLYLDIDIEDSRVESRNADVIEDIGTTENSLSECLDLHLVVVSRSGVNTPLPSQILPPETLKKYETMSDAEVIMDIKRKCTQSMELVNRILRKIQEAQPKKKSMPLITSLSSDNMPVKSPVERTNLAASTDANSLLGVNSNSFDKQKSYLRETDIDINEVQMDNATLTLLEELPTSNETASDNYTSESKLISSRSTISSTNAGIFDTNFTHTTEVIVQDNNHNSSDEELLTDTVKTSSTYNETTDAYFFIDTNDTFTDENETDSDVSIVSGMTSDYNQHQDNISAKEDTTAQHNIEKYSMNDDGTTYYYEVDAESKTTESSFLADTTADATTLPTQQDSSASQRFHTGKDTNISEESQNVVKKTDDVTRKVTKPRQVLRESEIMIPKILTKELANGSVVSNIQGYERLPNGDFTLNSDDSSYEDSSGVENALFSSRRQLFDSNHVSEHESGISGNLYFIFDKALIPARFLQGSDGLVSLGLNGNSMCQNFLKNHTHRSQFLSKLCKAVINDRNDKIPSGSIHNVKNSDV